MTKIHIEYCVKWNYGPEFDRVSKIINRINSNVIIEGNKISPRSGSFEVTLDDVIVYSKFETGKFPDESEISTWIL